MTLSVSPTGSGPLTTIAPKKEPNWLEKFNKVKSDYLVYLEKWNLEIKNNLEVANNTEATVESPSASSSAGSAVVKETSAEPSGSGTGDITLKVIPSRDTLLLSAVQSQLLQIFVTCLGELYKVALEAHLNGQTKLYGNSQISLKGTLDQFFSLDQSSFVALVAKKAVEDATWNRTADFIRKTKGIFRLTGKKYMGNFGRIFLHIYVRNMFQHANGRFNSTDIVIDKEVTLTWCKLDGKRCKILDEIPDGATIELNWFVLQDLLNAIIRLITNATVK